ncbi:hypothetical protein [Streptomyces sp.]|uniref:hypothetical protein n=1 Tax=Streptomyces sp. TaxID=1931 RepID=UPI002810AA00|nr:hypothetical protein [Streptomyces sp.]
MSPLRTLRRIAAPTGRHRRPRATGTPDRIQVSLDGLLDIWPAPSRPHDAAAVQCWNDCEPCGRATAGIVHADGWTCGECLTTAPARTTGEA